MDNINKVRDMVEMICLNSCEDPDVTNEVLTLINSVMDQIFRLKFQLENQAKQDALALKERENQIVQLTEKLEAWRMIGWDYYNISQIKWGTPKLIERLQELGEVE